MQLHKHTLRTPCTHTCTSPHPTPTDTSICTLHAFTPAFPHSHTPARTDTCADTETQKQKRHTQANLNVPQHSSTYHFPPIQGQHRGTPVAAPITVGAGKVHCTMRNGETCRQLARNLQKLAKGFGKLSAAAVRQPLPSLWEVSTCDQLATELARSL